MSNYYSKLKEKYGKAAKIPRGWRLVRVGERLNNNSKLFLFSIKKWTYCYPDNIRREKDWDYRACYINKK